MSEKELIIDTRGLRCPIPVLKASKVLESMNSGQVMKLLTTDPSTKIDVPRLVERTGDKLISVEEEEDVLVFTIKKI